MKTNCPNCGAPIEVSDQAQSAVCPFCGGTVALASEKSLTPPKKSKKGSDQPTPQRLIPFKISEQEAVEVMKNHIKKYGDIPVADAQLRIESISSYMLPMYIIEGSIDVKYWYGRERQALVGEAHDTYKALTLANSHSVEVPVALRSLCEVVEYTPALEAASVASKSETDHGNPSKGCVVIKADTKPFTVHRKVCRKDKYGFWSYNPFSAFMYEYAYVVAEKQPYDVIRAARLGDSDSQTPNIYATVVNVAVYYICFTHNGKRYCYCVDGQGLICKGDFPIDRFKVYAKLAVGRTVEDDWKKQKEREEEARRIERKQIERQGWIWLVIAILLIIPAFILGINAMCGKGAEMGWIAGILAVLAYLFMVKGLKKFDN